MHEVSRERLNSLIAYYRQAKDLAMRTEAELLHIKVRAENMDHKIDGIKVLGLIRQAAADLRGLKAP